VLCFSNKTSTHSKGKKWQKIRRKKLFEQKQARVLGEKKNGAVIFVAFRNKKKGKEKVIKKRQGFSELKEKSDSDVREFQRISIQPFFAHCFR